MEVYDLRVLGVRHFDHKQLQQKKRLEERKKYPGLPLW